MTDDPRHEITNALRAQAELGLHEVPARWLDSLASAPPVMRPKATPPPTAPAGSHAQTNARERPQEAAKTAVTTPPSADAAAQPLPNDLDALRAVALGCRKCGLCESRTQVVFGVGNPHAALMFVGEAPGADEDRQGEPFVGAAGQKLNEIITKGFRMRREDVYIANVLKCRPPNNRDPRPDEIALCRPFLEKQIELIRPRVICALGAPAARTLLGSDAPISRLRGRFHSFREIPVMPTYHPAYLLRSPERARRPMWEDVQQIQARLAEPPAE